jgi:hypothetical protein
LNLGRFRGERKPMLELLPKSWKPLNLGCLRDKRKTKLDMFLELWKTIGIGTCLCIGWRSMLELNVSICFVVLENDKFWVTSDTWILEILSCMTRNLYPNVFRCCYVVVIRDMTIICEGISLKYHERMWIFTFDTLRR